MSAFLTRFPVLFRGDEEKYTSVREKRSLANFTPPTPARLSRIPLCYPLEHMGKIVQARACSFLYRSGRSFPVPFVRNMCTSCLSTQNCQHQRSYSPTANVCLNEPSTSRSAPISGLMNVLPLLRHSVAAASVCGVTLLEHLPILITRSLNKPRTIALENGLQYLMHTSGPTRQLSSLYPHTQQFDEVAPYTALGQASRALDNVLSMQWFDHDQYLPDVPGARPRPRVRHRTTIT